MSKYLFHDSLHDNKGGADKQGYDTAQICLNGHCANSSYEDYPEFNKAFCTSCGQPTIIACEQCKTSIRGSYRESLSLLNFLLPLFCHNCGQPYPWTRDRLVVATELAKELDGFDEQERAVLTSSLDDLVREGPRTTLAATRFKKLMAKAGTATAESFRKILVDVLSETAKKILWPDAK
jgi:hypothetical protein